MHNNANEHIHCLHPAETRLTHCIGTRHLHGTEEHESLHMYVRFCSHLRNYMQGADKLLPLLPSTKVDAAAQLPA